MNGLPSERSYDAADPERALKYAIRHHAGDRVQIVEGVIEPMSAGWDHEPAADGIRRQLSDRVRELDCVMGSGDLSCTLFSEPGALGYTRAVGPLPFGEPIELPEPFGLRVDTSEF
ncbi:hypothetical protein [Kitasatospora cineracea]|uniref:hypothetical protein n=1 Tax=Kitasatospora cineracea TaxID=88074 RepID=UPI0037A6B2B8